MPDRCLLGNFHLNRMSFLLSLVVSLVTFLFSFKPLVHRRRTWTRLMIRCGDYASGTNHTLPTNGFARQFSGVNTLSFQKHITSQELTADGLRALGPTVVTLAEREGLEAHANAVRVRLAALN